MYAVLFESNTKAMFEIVSDVKTTWYVVIIFVNNLVFNIPDRRFDCKLADSRCECNTIKILTNRIQEINKNILIEITFF